MSQVPLRFHDRVAIVTGSGRGLGREHALLLGRLGAHVVVNSTTPSTAEKTAKDIIDAGGKAIVHIGSVADRGVADSLVKKAVDTFGRVDIVINNAGFAKPVSFEDATNAFVSEMIDVHVGGSFNVTQAAWPYMKKQGYGRVIMITSHWIFGKAEQGIYAAAKLALVGLAKTIALEGKEHNILVNSVATAGFTDTIVENTDSIQAQELMKKYIPAAEAAPAVAWLAHEDCKVTGETIGAMGKIVTRIFIAETHGYQGASGQEWKVETVRDNWNQVIEEEKYAVHASTDEMGAAMFPRLMGGQS
ncbi:hypothetical protein BKA56DRAFT_605807 [Ilyonectria sp. MPI-CAGE-AT-0026]|nr:hypothetical protein BKA56DRAFT_605807 [Ilyonectria sp. MPI-CAGE-AT-0026]